MTQFLGYLGFVLLSLCALPLVISTVRAGNANRIDPWFLGLWFFGEVAMLGHAVMAEATWPLQLNYIANAVMVGMIVWYKLS